LILLSYCFFSAFICAICGRKSFPLIALFATDLFALSSFCAHLRHLREKGFPLISLMFADLFALSSFCAHLRHLREKKLPADCAVCR
jgi:amino acid permease